MLQIKNHKDGKNVIIYCYDEKNKFILIMNKLYFDYVISIARIEKVSNEDSRLMPRLEGYIFHNETTKEEFEEFLNFQDREDCDTDEYNDAYEDIQNASTMVDNDNFTILLFVNNESMQFEFINDFDDCYDDLVINTDEFISLVSDKSVLEAYRILKETLNRYDLYCSDDEVDLALTDLEQAIGYKK